MLDYADLANIQVTLRQPGVADRLLKLDEFMLQPGATDIEWAASGEVLARPLSLAGLLGPVSALESGGAVKLQLDGNLGELSLKLRGKVDDLGSGAGAELDALIETADIAPLLASANIELALQGPLRMEATVREQEDGTQLRGDVTAGGVETQTVIVKNGARYQLEQKVSSLSAVGDLLAVAGFPDQPLQLQGVFTPGDEELWVQELLLTLGDARIEVEGTVNTRGGISTLNVSAEGGTMAGLFAGLPDIPFQSGADIAFGPGHIALSSLSLKLGQSDISGELTLDHGEHIAMDADLESEFIDLAELMPPAEDAPAPAASTADNRYVFKEKPLPLESLQALDMDLRLLVRRLQNDHTVVEDVVVRGSAKDGKINTDFAAKGPHGGFLRNTLDLQVSDQGLSLVGEAYTRDMRLNLFSGDVTDPLKIPVNDVTAKVTSRGSSPRQLAVSAKGSVLVTQGEGLINNNLLGAVSGDVFAQLFNALNPLAKAEKLSKWECSLVLVNIENGNALLEQMILQGEKVMIVGGGEIDLATEQLKLEFNTKPRKGVGVSADMFIKPFVALKGTLASPAIGLNEKGTLISAGAAVATGGLSFLVKAAADRLGGSVDHCTKTLPDFPHPPLPE